MPFGVAQWDSGSSWCFKTPQERRATALMFSKRGSSAIVTWFPFKKAGLHVKLWNRKCKGKWKCNDLSPFLSPARIRNFKPMHFWNDCRNFFPRCELLLHCVAILGCASGWCYVMGHMGPGYDVYDTVTTDYVEMWGWGMGMPANASKFPSQGILVTWSSDRGFARRVYQLPLTRYSESDFLLDCLPWTTLK